MSFDRPKGWAATSARILARDAYVCWLCHKYIPEGERSIDHVIPRSKGGGHEDSNLASAHMRCNASRKDKTVLPRARPSRFG